jgi:hypothetical protein
MLTMSDISKRRASLERATKSFVAYWNAMYGAGSTVEYVTRHGATLTGKASSDATIDEGGPCVFVEGYGRVPLDCIKQVKAGMVQ